MKTRHAILIAMGALALGLSLPVTATVLYQNNFSSVGANPAADGWVYDGSTLNSYGSYAAWPVTPTDKAMSALGAWSHALTLNSASDSIITISMTLENEGANSGARGGFGLSSDAANTHVQFTADGPRLMWTAPWTGSGSGDIGTFTLTGPVAGGSVTATANVPSDVNDYWRRATVMMEVNTATGIASGYYVNGGTTNQVITNFDMKGSLTVSQFNALFANGGMQNFGGAFAGSGAGSWIDNINISDNLVPEPTSLALLVLGGYLVWRKVRRS